MKANIPEPAPHPHGEPVMVTALNHAEDALAHRFIGLEADDEAAARALCVPRAEDQDQEVAS